MKNQNLPSFSIREDGTQEFNFKSPSSWEELSDDQLRYVLSVMALHHDKVVIKCYLLARFCGLTVHKYTRTGWKCSVKCDESDGIQALSSLLQNTLTNKNEYITIQEELENLENYFSILRIRYAGSFEYSFHVEEDELLSCLVPKLILQPLAENSVMHGSSDNGTVMEIQITCWRENEDVIIELSDDGKGFEVTDDALAPHPERKRIGVANVNDRIQLNFGRKYGLKINSQPGKGTTCTLTLPELYADTLS